MSELTFIFGPNNAFFFDSPKSWKFYNLPPTLRPLFNSSMSPAWRIAQPFCLALGPQINSPEPIWYCGCRVLDGQEKLFYSQTYFDLNYPDLSKWTKGIPNAPRACFITFGTGLSYFASARGHGSIWAGVNSELMDKVQKTYDTPTCVALGINEAWFAMWPDGYYAWKFYGNYGGLDSILTEAQPGTVSYVAISPYNKEQYFIAFKDRTVKYNFVGAPEWIPQIQEVFNEWQAEIMQKQVYQQPQQPYTAVPSHLNQYLPQPGQPAYVAAHYANSPHAMPQYGLSCGSPRAPVPPQTQFAVELPGSMPPSLKPPSVTPSVISSSKRRSFFSSKKKSSSKKRDAASVTVDATSTAATMATGSQTCSVM